MSKKHTLNELNSMSREDLITIVLTMQGQLDTLNDVSVKPYAHLTNSLW